MDYRALGELLFPDVDVYKRQGRRDNAHFSYGSYETDKRT